MPSSSSNPARLRRAPVPRGDEPRRGAVVVLAAACLVLLFGFLAFSIDVGYMAVVEAELQTAVDAAALAAADEMGELQPQVAKVAKDIAAENMGEDSNLNNGMTSVEEGRFDFDSKTFKAGGRYPNAVRVSASVQDHPLFFAPLIGTDEFSMTKSAIAMLNPRDILFVVDLSGSMNDDVEPLWASKHIEDTYAGTPDAGIGMAMAKQLWADLGFPFPGDSEHLGKSAEEFVLLNDPGYPDPLVPEDDFAYAELTDDNGPLASSVIPDQYRILVDDDEQTRRRKGYSWIIDTQIQKLMPQARPYPDSSNEASYTYWAPYIDYVVTVKWVHDPTPPPPPPPPTPPAPTPTPPPTPTPTPTPPPTPPAPPTPTPPPPPPRPVGNIVPSSAVIAQLAAATIGTAMPPGQPRRGKTEWIPVPPNGPHGAHGEFDKLYNFNNPNKFTYGSVDTAYRDTFYNKIGYPTYVQYMLDWGRDRSPNEMNNVNADPAIGQKVELSLGSPNVRRHSESVGSETFSFPARTQPMHACRRSMISAIQTIKTLNKGVSVGVADRIGIVVFDGDDAYHAPEVVQPLTSNYRAAMNACAQMQAVSDIGATTATENALILAREHLRVVEEGGAGRPYAKKLVILLSDGVPNEWQTGTAEMNTYMTANPNPDYYAQNVPWVNAPLIQAARMSEEDTDLHSIGIGIGADYGFLDRMARLSGTADADGKAARGPINPDEYEARLTEILEQVIKHPGTRLVE